MKISSNAPAENPLNILRIRSAEAAKETALAEPATIPKHSNGDAAFQSRRLDVPYIRTIAALAVVQIHSVGDLLFTFDAVEAFEGRWWVGNLYCSFLRWATPFFILLSGSVMLPPSRKESPGKFLRKRMWRVLPPFALWSAVYLLYQYRGSFSDGNWPTWSEIGHKVFFEDVYYHLWFLPMIIGLYFLTPTFKVFVNKAKRSDIEYFLLFSFSVTALQHFLPNLFIVKYIGWLGYIGFYVLGYYLSRYTLPWKKYLYAAALLMPVLTFAATWMLSRQTGTYNDKFYIYFSPNVVIMTAAFFLFLREADWAAFAVRFPRLNKLILWFAPFSFGVYFIHVLLLDIFKNAYIGHVQITSEVFFNQPVAPYIGAFLQAVVVATCSVLIIALLNKIPVLRRWLM